MTTRYYIIYTKDSFKFNVMDCRVWNERNAYLFPWTLFEFEVFKSPNKWQEIKATISEKNVQTQIISIHSRKHLLNKVGKK